MSTNIQDRPDSTAQHPLLRRTDLTVHELDGEALLYDPISAGTHRLNSTALFVWRECDGRRDLWEIADRLAETYEVGLPEAREHTARILEEFQRQQLVIAIENEMDGATDAMQSTRVS